MIEKITSITLFLPSKDTFFKSRKIDTVIPRPGGGRDLGHLVDLQASHAVVDAGLDDRHVERVSDLDRVAGSSGFKLRNVGKFTKFANMICRTLDGSFSAVSKPTFGI